RGIKLLKLVESIPKETGVYYLHDKKGKILHIGQSKNIRRRVNQHFTSTTAKNKRLQKEVAKVSFALTGNLLIAKLKEDDDIKNIKPKYTRRSRKALFPYHLVQQKDSDGYIRLKVEKTDLRKRSLMTFKSLTVAQNNLKRISKEF